MERTNSQIERDLAQLPSEMWAIGQESVDLRKTHDLLKAQYERDFNRLLLRFKAERAEEKLTVQDLKALAENECFALKLDVIKAEAAWKAKECDWEQAKNQFDACRSIIKLRCSEMESSIRT